jgi:hypothetical protein
MGPSPARGDDPAISRPARADRYRIVLGLASPAYHALIPPLKALEMATGESCQPFPLTHSLLTSQFELRAGLSPLSYDGALPPSFRPMAFDTGRWAKQACTDLGAFRGGQDALLVRLLPSSLRCFSKLAS